MLHREREEDREKATVSQTKFWSKPTAGGEATLCNPQIERYNGLQSCLKSLSIMYSLAQRVGRSKQINVLL